MIDTTITRVGVAGYFARRTENIAALDEALKEVRTAYGAMEYFVRIVRKDIINETEVQTLETLIPAVTAQAFEDMLLPIATYIEGEYERINPDRHNPIASEYPTLAGRTGFADSVGTDPAARDAFRYSRHK